MRRLYSLEPSHGCKLCNNHLSMPRERLLIAPPSFAPLDVANNKTGAGIQSIFDQYNIPSDFISQRLEAVTHSFGANYDKSGYCTFGHRPCR